MIWLGRTRAEIGLDGLYEEDTGALNETFWED